MKQETFTLSHDEAKGNVLARIAKIPTDGKTEVIIRDARIGKTMEQLGAIFGLWEKELSEKHGHSIKKVHEWLKDNFLARIYVTEPLGDAQEQWVELLAVYQMAGKQEKLERHAKRISLAWATLKQTKQFMDDIEAHFQDIGQPLTVPDPEWRSRR